MEDQGTESENVSSNNYFLTERQVMMLRHADKVAYLLYDLLTELSESGLKVNVSLEWDEVGNGQTKLIISTGSEPVGLNLVFPEGSKEAKWHKDSLGIEDHGGGNGILW